jgi:hypothetical protein
MTENFISNYARGSGKTAMLEKVMSHMSPGEDNHIPTFGKVTIGKIEFDVIKPSCRRCHEKRTIGRVGGCDVPCSCVRRSGTIVIGHGGVK